MLAYDELELMDLAVREHAEHAAKREVITQAENETINTAYPVNFYSPNIFMRIGLGLVTATATIAIGSLILVLIRPKSSIPFYFLIIAAGMFLLLELFIRKYHHLRSGIDDVLLYSILIFIYMSLATSRLTDINNFHLLFSLTATIAGILAVVRYADRLAAFQSLFTGVFFLGALWYKMGTLAKFSMPIIMIMLFISVYTLARQYRNSPSLLHYTGCFRILEIFSLCGLYAACNFYIADLWWNAQLNISLSSQPSKYFFIISSILVPLWCLFSGLNKRDLIRLRLSVLMIAASVITFHHYVKIITDEVAMILYGIILIISAYVLLKKLKGGVAGYTHLATEDSAEWIDLEELLVGGSFSRKMNATGKTNQH